MADERDDLNELTDLVSGWLKRAARRGRTELARAADVGRQQLELRQARADLQDFWQRLGQTAYRLSEAGEIDHPALDKARDRIDALQARIAALEAGQRDPEPGDDAP